jgi:hypothetical protein
MTRGMQDNRDFEFVFPAGKDSELFLVVQGG